MALEDRLVLFGRVARQGFDLQVQLEHRGFRVYQVELEEELFDVMLFSQPDVLVVVGTPGLAFMARVLAARQKGGRGVLAVVWPGAPVETAVRLLELGVDYVAPSYQPDWLAAQLHACLRRLGNHRLLVSRIDLGRLTIDLQQRQVIVGGREVALTPTEFEVLRVLAERPGTVLPSREIMQQVMGARLAESEAQDLLKVHIHRLRQKLELSKDEPRFIRTVRGHGYMYAFERRSAERLATGEDATPAQPLASVLKGCQSR